MPIVERKSFGAAIEPAQPATDWRAHRLRDPGRPAFGVGSSFGQTLDAEVVWGKHPDLGFDPARSAPPPFRKQGGFADDYR